MDLQSILTNAVQAKRSEDMKTSSQLTLGELILKLEAVKDKKLPIVFDGGKYKPTGLDSWRGSYCELAIEYGKENKYTVQSFLKELKKTIGKTFTGYKGGDFLMGKTTPIWVANYGEGSGFKKKKDKNDQAVIDIKELKTKVVIITEAMDY